MSGSTQKVSISDDAGRRLAEATAWLSDDGLIMALGRVHGGGELLTYYFGKGKRPVHVVLGELALAGRLQTRWQGSRRTWLIRLESPVPLTEAAEAGATAPHSNLETPRAADPATAAEATLPSAGRP